MVKLPISRTVSQPEVFIIVVRTCGVPGRAPTGLGSCAPKKVVFLYYNIIFFESQARRPLCGQPSRIWGCYAAPDRGSTRGVAPRVFGSNRESGICRSCDEKNCIWCFGVKFGPAPPCAGRPNLPGTQLPGRRRGSPQFPLQNLIHTAPPCMGR